MNSDEYRLLQDMQRQLSEINGKIGMCEGKLLGISSDLADNTTIYKNHSDRIRRLEQAILPIYAVVVGAATWLANRLLWK